MKTLRAANSLFRSNAAPITAVSRSSLLLASKLPTATTSQFAAALSSPSSFSSLPQLPLSRPFSHSSICQKKRGQVEEEDSGRRGRRRGGAAEEEESDGKRGGKKARGRQETAAEEEDTTEPAGKKGKKAGKDSSASSSSSSSSTSSTPASTPADPDQPIPSAENPYLFSDLTYVFDKAEKRYAEELRKLRSGGRFNADVIGAIPVTLEKNSHTSFPLRELATVAPLGGRRWSILAFEEESVKHIQSAVQRSPDFNQQPQRSEDNPLELTMTVELERADTLVKHAKEICQNWRNKIRDEAHRREALHKKWKADNLIVKDDVYKLKEKMKKLQDDKMKVIATKEKEVTAQIMSKAG
ncbi:ribosome recycling factor-domain-containing protein [Cladorrhinum sp. PSN332]|nr:ribosome recycling factor-domain-containing protein [Cladorrhinum sp. PSN332]